MQVITNLGFLFTMIYSNPLSIGTPTILNLLAVTTIVIIIIYIKKLISVENLIYSPFCGFLSVYRMSRIFTIERFRKFSDKVARLWCNSPFRTVRILGPLPFERMPFFRGNFQNSGTSTSAGVASRQPHLFSVNSFDGVSKISHPSRQHHRANWLNHLQSKYKLFNHVLIAVENLYDHQREWCCRADDSVPLPHYFSPSHGAVFVTVYSQKR